VFTEVGVLVGLFVTVAVAEDTVTTAPFKGAPLKFTGPVPLAPDRFVTFMMPVWKAPLAVAEKLSTTR